MMTSRSRAGISKTRESCVRILRAPYGTATMFFGWWKSRGNGAELKNGDWAEMPAGSPSGVVSSIRG